ncbi:MAG: hypothetical protein WD002_08720 [Pseudomonadales bacterium]
MDSTRHDLRTRLRIDLRDYSITTLLQELEEEISRLEALIKAAEKSKSEREQAA